MCLVEELRLREGEARREAHTAVRRRLAGPRLCLPSPHPVLQPVTRASRIARLLATWYLNSASSEAHLHVELDIQRGIAQKFYEGKKEEESRE